MVQVSSNMEGKSSIQKSLHINSTNYQVNNHNKRDLEHFPRNDAQIFKVRSQNTLVNIIWPSKRNTALFDTVIKNDIN